MTTTNTTETSTTTLLKRIIASGVSHRFKQFHLDVDVRQEPGFDHLTVIDLGSFREYRLDHKPTWTEMVHAIPEVADHIMNDLMMDEFWAEFIEDPSA
jgi:hypothetical protein